MSSKKEWIAALDAVDHAHRAVAGLPFHTLQPADQRALLVRLDALEKLLATRQRQLLAHMVGGPPPVEFAGAPWAEVLAVVEWPRYGPVPVAAGAALRGRATPGEPALARTGQHEPERPPIAQPRHPGLPHHVDRHRAHFA